MPQPLLKVIDKIEVKRTFTNNPVTYLDTRLIKYNQNKEISEIQYYVNNINEIEYAITFEYENNRPKTSTITPCCDPSYQVNYSYENDIFKGWSSIEYGDVPFEYFPQFQMYKNVGIGYGNYTYFMSPYNDITVKTTNEEYAYEFETAHKGPLFNVVNKKWISLFWQFGSEPYNVLTTYPYLNIYDETNSQLTNVISEYDQDGFIKSYKYTMDTKNYEIIFTYKSI